MSVETTATRPSTTMSGQIVDSIGDIVVASLEATAQISLGQGLLRFADRFLWMVEKSAQWSLPVQEVNSAEENGKAFGKLELVRPLPWILFLPSLVILRVCKIGLNVGAVILGFPQVQTTGVVKFIQKGRRRLRTIKSNGMRRMRYRRGVRNKEDELSEAKKSLIKSMLSTLSAFSCLETSRRAPSPTPTRVYIERLVSDTTATTPEPEHSTTESTSPQVDYKRKYSEVTGTDENSELHSEEELTEAKLERLAAEDSEADDHEFDPAVEDLAAGSSSSEEEEDYDDYISESEINDLRKACNLIAVEEVIVEEPEPEPEPDVEAASAPDSKSVPNKIVGENFVEVNGNDSGKVTENNKPQVGYLTPVTSVSHVEQTGNYYSPVSSPGEFTTPESKDGELLSPNKNSSIKETSIGNGDCDSSATSTISGSSPDDSRANKTTNGTTNADSQSSKKRNNGTGKSHRKGNKKNSFSPVCKQA